MHQPSGSIVSGSVSNASFMKGPFYRQVSIEAAKKFAKDENLLFLGESSCKTSQNCSEIFDLLIAKVHEMQTDLVRSGVKNIEDLRYGEEERKITYNRCCY